MPVSFLETAAAESLECSWLIRYNFRKVGPPSAKASPESPASRSSGFPPHCQISRKLLESSRQFDCVLFCALDRLTREGMLETLQHLQRLTGS